LLATAEIPGRRVCLSALEYISTACIDVNFADRMSPELFSIIRVELLPTSNQVTNLKIGRAVVVGIIITTFLPVLICLRQRSIHEIWIFETAGSAEDKETYTKSEDLPLATMCSSHAYIGLKCLHICSHAHLGAHG